LIRAEIVAMKSLLGISSFACVLFLLVSTAHADSKKDEVASYIKDLKRGNAKTRATAAKELGNIGAISAADTKEAVPLLIELLKNDRDKGVKQAAATALGRIDPDPEKAVTVLITALKDKTAAVRAAAATSLGQLGAEAKDAVPALRTAQDDKDRGVSRAARMAIRTIEGQKKK
jgi:HEAT repeat protein